MNREYVMRASGTSVTLRHLRKEYLDVHYEGHGAQVHTVVFIYNDIPELVSFFKNRSREDSNDISPKTWTSVEGDLGFMVARQENGSFKLRVTVSALKGTPEEWTFSGSMTIDFENFSEIGIGLEMLVG